MASPCAWRWWCSDTHLSQSSYSSRSRPRRPTFVRLAIDDQLIRGGSPRANFPAHRTGLELETGGEAPRRRLIKTSARDDGWVDDEKASLLNCQFFLQKAVALEEDLLASTKSQEHHSAQRPHCDLCFAGLADPAAIQQAIACYLACHFLGMQECNVNLAQCVAYLAKSRKSVVVYRALSAAEKVVKESGGRNESVPLHLTNAPTDNRQKDKLSWTYRPASSIRSKPELG